MSRWFAERGVGPKRGRRWRLPFVRNGQAFSHQLSGLDHSGAGPDTLDCWRAPSSNSVTSAVRLSTICCQRFGPLNLYLAVSDCRFRYSQREPRGKPQPLNLEPGGETVAPGTHVEVDLRPEVARSSDG